MEKNVQKHRRMLIKMRMKIYNLNQRFLKSVGKQIICKQQYLQK